MWKGKIENAKGAKVSWLDVCYPRTEGGLGSKKLTKWNIASFARLIWLICSGSDSMWIAWIKAHLLKERSFWAIKSTACCTWNWRKMLKLRTILRPMIKHIVGDGKRIYLWHDNWHPVGPLSPKFGYRLIYDSGLHFQAKLNAVINGTDWFWPATRSNDMVGVQASLCGSLTPSSSSDVVLWLPSKSHKFQTCAT